MIKRSLIAIPIALLLCFGSCSYVFVEAYGIDHHVNNLSQSQTEKAPEKLGIAQSEMYWMDTSFVEYLSEFDTYTDWNNYIV